MEQDHMLSNETYNFLKQLVRVWLPALGVFYITLAQIWDLPNPEAVAATIMAVATLLGVLLNVSTSSWNNSEAKYDGELVVTANDQDTGIPDLQLVVKRDPNELAAKRTVRLRMSDRRAA